MNAKVVKKGNVFYTAKFFGSCNAHLKGLWPATKRDSESGKWKKRQHREGFQLAQRGQWKMDLWLAVAWGECWGSDCRRSLPEGGSHTHTASSVCAHNWKRVWKNQNVQEGTWHALFSLSYFCLIFNLVDHREWKPSIQYLSFFCL